MPLKKVLCSPPTLSPKDAFKNSWCATKQIFIPSNINAYHKSSLKIAESIIKRVIHLLMHIFWLAMPVMASFLKGQVFCQDRYMLSKIPIWILLIFCIAILWLSTFLAWAMLTAGLQTIDKNVYLLGTFIRNSRISDSFHLLKKVKSHVSNNTIANHTDQLSRMP